MSYKFIKNGILGSTILFILFVIVSIVQYIAVDAISLIVYQAMIAAIVSAAVFGFHIWSTSIDNSTSLQKISFKVLKVETILSIIVASLYIFDIFRQNKTIIVFGLFQIIHLSIYVINVFLYDESPIQSKTLSDEDIVKKSKHRTVDPSEQ